MRAFRIPVGGVCSILCRLQLTIVFLEQHPKQMRTLVQVVPTRRLARREPMTLGRPQLAAADAPILSSTGQLCAQIHAAQPLALLDTAFALMQQLPGVALELF